jgi:HEAT repeat protein
MFCRRNLLAAAMAAPLVMLVGSSLPAEANPGSAPGGAAPSETDKLAAVLRSGAPHEQKLLTCKRLALVGSGESVPVLAPLLVDEKLAHAARIALEAIPDPAAAEALRNAVSRVHGQLLVGVINSLGARRDLKAAAVLITRLGDVDAEVACAAAGALGKIATGESVQALERALAASKGAVRVTAGDALLACAETLARQGNRREAAAIDGRLRRAGLPKKLRLAAARGEILAGSSAGIELLIAQLTTEDEETFAAAIGVGREVAGPEATRAIAGLIPRLLPGREAMLLTVLADRGDLAARPAVLKAARQTEPAVRIAAISALATLGDTSVLALLLDAAGEPDPRIAAAAQDTLAALSGPGVDEAIAGMLEKTAGQARRVVVEAIGRRRIGLAVPALLKAAGDSDRQTRLAAIRALGATVAAEQLSALSERLLDPKSPEESAAAKEALKTACTRLIDKETCAEKLAACLPRAASDGRRFLLELLGAVGGPTALQAVAAAAFDPGEETRDVATRVLGQWHSPDAAPTLMAVARKSANDKLRTRALRGYIRIIRQMDLSDEQRLAMCQEAMVAAARDTDRTLVLDVLGRIALPQALAQVMPHLHTAALKQVAGSAAVSIAEKLVAAHPAVAAEAVRKVLAASTTATLAHRANAVLARAGRTSPTK